MARTKRSAKLEDRTNRGKLKAGSRHFVAAGEGLALGYRKNAEGYGLWQVRQWHPDGYQFETFGEADDLREADGKTVFDYFQAFDRARRGVLKGTVTVSGLTVGKVVDTYVDHLRSHKGDRAADDAKGKLDRSVVPVLGSTLVAELTLTQLQKWLGGLVRKSKDDPDKERKSKDTANRVLATFKASLNHAFQDDANKIPTDAAWRKLKGFKGVGAAREDHFTEAEVLTLIDAAQKQDPAFADLLEATFHTGARPPGELAALEPRHFDAQNKQILIPEGKTGPRITTLTDEGVTFFKRLAKGKGPRDVLIPRSDGERWGKSHQHRPMKAALKEAKLPLTASAYTIRHTYISRSIENGMELMRLAKNVGTSIKMIEQNYAKFLAQKNVKLIQDFAPSLRVIKGGKVAPIRKKA